jgi:amino acid adenylation domain-containing protein
LSALLPLSIAQHEVLQDQRAWGQSPHLLVGGCGLLKGPVDAALLRAALADLIAEQPVLRLIPGLTGQRLLDRLEPPLILLPAPPGVEPLNALEALWRDWTQTAPPLGEAAAAPPWRIALLRFDAQLHGFLLWAHHSLLDGYATAFLAQRWAALVSARTQGKAAPILDGEVFLRHLDDDAAYPRSPSHAADAAFWREELPAAPAPLFPSRALAGRLPPAFVSTQWLGRDEYAGWARLAQLEGQSEFAALAAALAWHYAALLDRDEILIGVPTLNRHGRAQRQALGMFVGVMPLRLQLAGVQTPRQLIALVGRQMRRAMRHARYPASSLARQLKLAQAGRDHLFDLLLSFERQDFSVRFGDAELCDSRQLFCGLARFPLSLTLCDFGPGRELALTAEGSSALFNERGLALLLQRLRHIAQQLQQHPEAPLHSLPLLPAAEREAVVDGLHRDLAMLPSAPSFIERFIEQATLHPHSLALVWDGGTLGYGALAQQVEQLAKRLRQAGVPAGEIVALALPRGPALIAAQLAVARAGACFLPLDLDWPDERVRQLLQQLQAGHWLGLQADRERLDGLHPGWLAVDAPAAPSQIELPSLPGEDQPAYALFTSGSTGTPKCVRVPHGALARRFAWLASVWDLGPADRSLQGTAASFDPSLIELLLPLTLGASVALPAPGRQPPERWAAFAARHGCSFTALVPTTLARLLDGIEALPEGERERLRLRVACSGGEVLPPQLAQRWLRVSRAALWNLYGPTEACIFATAWSCRLEETADILPVGSPVDDTRLYVLDAQLQPLPFGTPGDIWLGGPTLAIDYLGNPASTAERFRADPFQAGGRIYRTGDRGYLDGDGRLQFLGRADRQVKIRGQRVEPGEVEAALLALPGVLEACVLPWGEPPRLQAWLAPATLDLTALQQLARERLPDVLLPGGWTLVEALPRSASGKLQTSQLPPPELAGGGPGRAAVTPLETELLALLCRCLQRDDLGVDDDFFQAGGDSLAALDWLTAIEQRTGLTADLALLALAPTVAALARQLQLRAMTRAPVFPPLALPLSQPVAAPTLFLAASGHGDLLRFQQLAQALTPGCGLQMLQPPPGVPVQSLAQLAAAYGDYIRSQTQPGAGVLLAGFSVGGVVALETARWLREQGVTVQSLVLIDSVFPRWLFRQPWLWKLLGWLTRSLYVQELSMNGRRLGAMFKDAGLVGQVLALHAYRLAPYPDEVQLLRTSGLGRWQGWLFGPWRRQLRLREQEVQGLHGSIFEAGRVAGLAQCLRQALGLAPPPPPS